MRRHWKWAQEADHQRRPDDRRQHGRGNARERPGHGKVPESGSCGTGYQPGPVLVDSSDWKVIETGLKCPAREVRGEFHQSQGGEEEFLRQARLARRYGAAVIVMAFDDKGQADTRKRKVEICTRAFRLLTEEVASPPRTSSSIPMSSP